MSFSNSDLDKYVLEKYLPKQAFIYRQKVGPGVMKLWEEIVSKRKERSIQLDLFDQHGEKIWFVTVPMINTYLDKIEYGATQDIQEIISHVTDWDEKVHELLIDEAYNSSVIEGAVSTRKRTSEMLKKKQEPKDHSERMIYNNYAAMMHILDNIGTPLDEDVFIQLHKIITEGTLEDDDITEKYRDDDVEVKDLSTNRVIYHAPKARDVQWMMDDLFKFIHSDTPEIHPIIKACIIHFYIVYVHPFFDGNGRTARAFTVMFLLKQGFQFFKYLSISTAINQKKGAYYKSIEDCEKNPTDITYFIINQLELLLARYVELLEQLQTEVGKLIFNDWLVENGLVLSKRQHKEITLLSKKQKNFVTIEEYKKRHKVAYETARSDLMELEALGIFERMKVSRKFVYKFEFHRFISKLIHETNKDHKF
ncbi:Fic family protein [Paenibacillus forsythiae]|uniref:Fic family protein n=1 Tax=Paenibacillus forsythiae TaxID=365616 RepID=A0ABU3HF30_9BACL|nr:Fic family protein [Paenibacillus forsythiae]MDT3428672.1 Fic family protein [Paenibacillus forsythiae]